MYGIISIFLSIFVTLVLFLASKIGYSQDVYLWRYLAQVSGLLGSVLVSWNYILATRNSYIEKAFNGLDKAYKVHNIIGNIAFIFIINHPIFLILNSLPYNTVAIYLIPTLTNLSYAFGIFALYTLLILLTLTIFIDIPYKLWKKTHEYMGLVVILASIHGLLITSDISVFLPLKIWIIGFNIIAIICYLYKRFIYYLVRPNNNYVVSNITVDRDYILLKLRLTEGNSPISFKAGQFAFLSDDSDKRDEHPFSILESSTTEIILGAKIIGQFTKKLQTISVGTKLNIYGPFGAFSDSLKTAKNIVWISGGIGITPFLSMFNNLKDDQIVTMIHTTRSDESKLFSDMFLRYAKFKPNFKFIIHYSDTLGHLDEEKINSYVKLDRTTYVYLCGPKHMMEDLASKLPLKGVLQKRIIFEDFDLK